MLTKFIIFALTASCTSLFQESKTTLLNIIMLYGESIKKMFEATPFYNKILSFNFLFIIILTSFMYNMTFYGIKEPRAPFSFFFGVIFYSFFAGYLHYFEIKEPGILIKSAQEVLFILSSIITIVFLIFYPIFRPAFMAIVIYMVFEGILSAFNADLYRIVEIIILIGIIVAVQFAFKKISWIFKFVLVGVFSLYGSLGCLLFTAMFINLPPSESFTKYLSDLNAKDNGLATIAGTYTLLWLIVAGCGAAVQILFVPNGDKSESGDDKEESK